MKNVKKLRYALECVATGRIFRDNGWTLDDVMCKEPSLIRARYLKRQIEVKSDDYGIYKFGDWLPVIRQLEGSSAPVTYQSSALADVLGLSRLFITFNGYNPSVGASMQTCSFKETEAYSVCARIPAHERRTLVVASAGNTARAFAKVCSQNNIPLLLCVPHDNIDSLWFSSPISPCVRLITSRSGSDYFDAIKLSEKVLHSPMFYAEGGAKNIARRDGMATTVLSAVNHIGQIPDYYFQAVGSGTGAIAAWEANIRLNADGRYGRKKMRLMVSQNAPFAPIYRAWRDSRRELYDYPDSEARRDAHEALAKVLSNRRPPYGIAGGLYDALRDSRGDIFAIENDELRRACELFEQHEGVDICPAAGVALASLMRSVDEGRVLRHDTVMLNITGGGERLYRNGRQCCYLTPDATFDIDAPTEEVTKFAESLFGAAEIVVA